jgi:hypothetical protein
MRSDSNVFPRLLLEPAVHAALAAEGVKIVKIELGRCELSVKATGYRASQPVMRGEPELLTRQPT